MHSRGAAHGALRGKHPEGIPAREAESSASGFVSLWEPTHRWQRPLELTMCRESGALILCSVWPWLPHPQPGLPCHEGGLFIIGKKVDRAGDLRGLAHPSVDSPASKILKPLLDVAALCMPASRPARSMGVSTAPGRIALTRILSGANSIAMARVSARALLWRLRRLAMLAEV